MDDFYMGIYEVTPGEYTSIMEKNPSWFKNGDNYPVEEISWNDVRDFIKKLNKKEGKKLPASNKGRVGICCTEQREKEKYAGANNLSKLAWCRGNSGGITHKAGGKAPNGLGIL